MQTNIHTVVFRNIFRFYDIHKKIKVVRVKNKKNIEVNLTVATKVLLLKGLRKTKGKANSHTSIRLC
jgi:hypothetical protein